MTNETKAEARKTSAPRGNEETRFERGVADALRTLGVPVRRDLQQLTTRVEQLSAAVAALARERANARQ